LCHSTPAIDDRVINYVRVLGTNHVRRADTVRRIELETRPRGQATVVYGIHEADKGHINRTTCADPNYVMASTEVPGARSYIDAGNKKLDARSQNMLTKMEALQDTVENVKDDVLERHVSPKPQELRSINEGLMTVNMELGSLKDHIKKIKLMWKKIWQEELQSLVEEQQFLNH
jgi:hypothetical protein